MIEAPFSKIDWRVDSQPYERDSGTVCRYVPYLDASTVAALLDEWVGPSNWADTYEPTTLAGKPALWCHLSVREKADMEWVTKTDVGVPSNMQAEKGMVSDAFKRAATLKWGVGRNVYEMPTVWAPCDTYQANNKKQAKPNAHTVAGIRTALEKAGIHPDEMGRAHEGDEDEPHGRQPAAKERLDRIVADIKLCKLQQWVKDNFEWPYTEAECDAIDAKLATYEAPFDTELEPADGTKDVAVAESLL